MSQQRWLACVVSPGPFRNEWAVAGSDFEGREFCLFSPRELVRCKEPPAADGDWDARLQVELLGQRDQLCLVRLPSPTFDNGATITVRLEQLA